jgi:elongation factor Ts
MAVSVEDIKKLRAMTSAGMALCKEALEASGGDFDKAVEYINKKSDVISRLRNLTGVKIGLAKIALADADQDFEKAVEIIKERGWDDPLGDTSEAVEGIIDAYVHGIEKKSVALVEVTCKTDFVARNEEFRTFVHELALQVAAMKPEFVSEEDIPAAKLKDLKSAFKREVEEEKKPKEIIKKIIEGKMNSYLAEHVLLNQKWFKDESKTMKNLLDEAIQKMGEPLKIRRMLFWELGK